MGHLRVLMDIILLQWFVEEERELDERETERILSDSIRLQLHAALQQHYLNGEPAAVVASSVTDGHSNSRTFRKIASKDFKTRAEHFMIGDPASVARIGEIESAKGFMGWAQPELADLLRS